VPLGVWVSRSRRLEAPVLGVASVLQTVPSLALLAFMVPLFALAGRLLGWELRSIGFAPALVALTLYGVLPMLRNTVTGLEGVDPALVEAARGVGMTDRQRLLRVELPLALPVIVAGVRTSTVWVVGTATLATPVGATSLGNFIFSGLQTRNFGAVLLGSGAAAALALLLDALVRGLERGLRRRSRALLAASAGGLAALALYAALAAAAGASLPGGSRPLVVGAKTFTEQYVLAHVLQARIEERTGRRVRQVPSLGSTVAFDALRAGEIDAYVDYSGTLWATVLGREELPEERSRVLEEVRSFLRRESGVEVVASLGFENTYALAMRGDHAQRLGVETVSGLVSAAPRLSIGADYEFFARPEWRVMREAYGLRFAERRSMDSALMYQAVRTGAVDVITAFSTDGRIAAYDLRVLREDRGVIPPYDAVVLVRPGLAREAPEAVAALRSLDGVLDAETMRRLNRAVDARGRSPERVARDFLAGRIP